MQLRPERRHRGRRVIRAPSVPNIYAVGDVTNRINLTPVAIREGHAFADTVFGGRPTAVDHANVPTAVFSEPEVGVVGLTEDAGARAPRRRSTSTRPTFRPMKATLSGRDTRVLMKLVVDGATDRVVGCHIVGDGRRRDDPARRHRGEDGRDQGRFRRHHGGASDRGRGTRHHARSRPRATAARRRNRPVAAPAVGRLRGSSGCRTPGTRASPRRYKRAARCGAAEPSRGVLASWPSVGRPTAGARSRSCRCRTIRTRRRWPTSRSSLRPFRRWCSPARRAS